MALYIARCLRDFGHTVDLKPNYIDLVKNVDLSTDYIDLVETIIGASHKYWTNPSTSEPPRKDESRANKSKKNYFHVEEPLRGGPILMGGNILDALPGTIQSTQLSHRKAPGWPVA